VHAGAFTRVDLCETERAMAFEINAEASGRIARLCAERQIPIVYISTDFVFDGTKKTPYETFDYVAPLSVYGESKLAGEIAVRQATPNHYIVRTSWVFGEYGQNFPVAILKSAANGNDLRVVDDQIGAPTYTVDLAEVILNILHREIPFGTYHACNGGSCSWFEFAIEILNQSGWSNPIVPIKSSELNRPAVRPAYSLLSMHSLSQHGFSLRDWREALNDYLANLQKIRPELFPTVSAYAASCSPGRQETQP
jgi:dTDP-4-dehydrorhamnose reductase